MRAIFSKFYQGNSKKGSILLEIAVGISVLAIISGFVIRKSIVANSFIREQQTKANINTLVISIASFVAANQRLPRPSETNNGIESNSTNLKSGYLPYHTLGIPESITKDGNLKPFIYMVEPKLTEDHPKIYGDEFDINVFCKNISTPAISIQGSPYKGIIAFAIDSKYHKNVIGEKVEIHPTAHTVWITRDMLLMKYIKNSPCSMKKPQQNENQHLQDFDDDF